MLRTAPLFSLLALLLVIAACAHTEPKADPEWLAQTVPEIRSRIKAIPRSVGAVEGEFLVSPGAVMAFYKQRKYAPAWLDGAALSKQVDALRAVLEETRWDGLWPEDYHVIALSRLTHQWSVEPSGALAASIDLLLTDAFCSAGMHLFLGRVNPRALSEDWVIRRRGVLRIDDYLRKALESGDAAARLRTLAPQTEAYAKLRDALKQFSVWEMAGAMPLPSGRKEIAEFQVRHGLTPDGRVGTRTATAMKMPIGVRTDMIRVNLERERWLPRDTGDRYLWVDIANFTLSVFEKGKTALTMRVAVGKEQKETPVFSRPMRYIVLNPAWSIPRTIALEEIVPKLKEDPGYLAKKGMKLYRLTRKGKKKEADPAEVDWSSVDEDHFPYLVQQEAGPKNPLGAIKFMFPNEFEVYLHGSPQSGVFAREVRTASHGCIRVEKPLVLAAYLLKDANPPLTEADLSDLIKTGEEKTIRLSQPIDVQLFYRTAWIDEKGVLQFRRDVYGWDKPVWMALKREGAPSSAE